MPAAPVVLTEADLDPGTWKDVLALADVLPKPPFVIVASIHADEHLWVEALNLGAHDVITKPFDKQEVTRVLSAGWSKLEQPGREDPSGKQDSVMIQNFLDRDISVAPRANQASGAVNLDRSPASHHKIQSQSLSIRDSTDYRGRASLLNRARHEVCTANARVSS
jgi:FixJ family two-component response regulator